MNAFFVKNNGRLKSFFGITIKILSGNEQPFIASVPKPVGKASKQPDNTLTPAPKKIKPYSINQQSFSAKETAFWKQYGITA
ncbi:MAG: hypothetical protein LBH04_12145, partial [Tannerellaceae bacterium]|nr:hypothetical protein [Tannerellaceae bacterium]